MKKHVAPTTIAAVLLWAMTGCNGVNQPFTFERTTGSCQYATTDGYDYCEDFLGDEYNQSVAQNACATGNGTWSPDACSTQGALGTCAVQIGTGDSQNVQYTYYPNGSSDAGVATALTAETACGLAGGSFTANAAADTQ